jgi:hypothetical protein
MALLGSEVTQSRRFRVKARHRARRCFELCNKGMMQPGAERFLLVHGLLYGATSHAVLLDPDSGQIYDAVADEWCDVHSYLNDKKFIATNMFTRLQVVHVASQTGYHGPWVLSDIQLALPDVPRQPNNATLLKKYRRHPNAISLPDEIAHLTKSADPT